MLERVIGLSDQYHGPAIRIQQSLTLFVIFRLFARVVEWPGAKYKVGTESHRVDPMCVLRQCPDELPLVSSDLAFSSQIGLAHVYPRPDFDSPITTSSVDHILPTPPHDIHTRRMPGQHEIKFYRGRVPYPDCPIF